MATKRSAKKSAKKSTSKKTYSTKSGKRSTTPPSKRWSAKVTTDSTKPAAGLFKESAKQIAEGLAKKSVSPEGPGQGMRMLNFYQNRGGKNLSAERKSTLEHAKKLLHEKIEKQASQKSPKKSNAIKSPARKSTTKSARKASR